MRRLSLLVLFIGNSFTYYNEMPTLLERVSASLGTPITAHFSGHGGATLRNHWDEGKAVQAIREHHYDFVIVQAQSSEIIRTPDETTRYARLLANEIRKSRAKPIVFVTWATRAYPIATQSQYTARYRALARQIGATVAPVGVAWERLESRGIELFDGSGSHPSLAGSYLEACVFYATLTGNSPIGATHTFDMHFDIPEAYRQSLEREKLDARTAEAIQRAAWEAVRQER